MSDMHSMITQRSRLAAEYTVNQLRSRGFMAEYAADRSEALQIALSWISAGKTVSWGGSLSVDEIGLRDAVRQGPWQVIDRDTAESPEERVSLMKQALTADVFLMSTNALSEDGQLVNIDGNGNRLAALCYGPDMVIVVAGINKLAHTLEDAVVRARTIAAPTNAQRFDVDTPCHSHGVCGNCHRPGCVCSQVLITRTSRVQNRIRVILVGEPLGY